MKRAIKNINKNLILLLTTVSIIIVSLLSVIYFKQAETIINQQRDQLVKLAEIASEQLNHYFIDMEEDIEYYFSFNEAPEVNKENLEEVISIRSEKFQKKFNESLRNITYLPMKNIQEYYKEELEQDIIKHYVNDAITKEKVIAGPWLYKEKYYMLHLLKAVIVEGEFQGLLVFECNLNDVYNNSIGEIKVGSYGYCTVKDQGGIILMHGDEKQIGIDSLNERKENYPELDPEGIERLVEKQLTGKSGSEIVESYWWGEDEVTKVKKIIGYSPVTIGEYKWVVNTIMSYNELIGPIRRSMSLIIILIILVVSILTVGILYITKIKYEKEEAILALKHTNELNETINKLRKHEENLGHNNRIQTMGIISSMMVHEIKNMLLPIFIYTEMLKNDFINNENVVNDVIEIEKAAENCLNLSKNLSAYSGNKKKVEVFNSSAEAKAVIEMLRPMIPKNIKLKESITKEVIQLTGNITEFKQIILNLCTNSYQAMEELGGELKVNYYKEQDRVILEVEDNGIGIPEEIQDKIFEPFFTMKPEEKGTGLGLAIVSKLVQKYNGYITLESKVGVGTKVKVIFFNENLNKNKIK